MAITYNWTITNLDRNTADGFVTTAHWTASAVDGNHTASVYSTVSWPVDEPQISYDNLTPEIVLGWVWESVDKTATEASLLQQINIKKNPVTASGRPW